MGRSTNSWNPKLKFSFSQLLDSNNDRPITTKKALNQKFSINKVNKYFILSGINNFSKTNKNEKVPFLGDIPLLGNLFKNDYVNNTFTTTTILIEFIEDTINFELNEKQLIEKYFNDDSWFWAVAATSATRKNSLDYF